MDGVRELLCRKKDWKIYRSFSKQIVVQRKKKIRKLDLVFTYQQPKQTFYRNKEFIVINDFICEKNV